MAVRGGQVVQVSCCTPTGNEYTAGAFNGARDRLGIVQSMGKPGSALDSAVIEAFHSTLSFELRAVEEFPTKAAAPGTGGGLGR